MEWYCSVNEEGLDEMKQLDLVMRPVVEFVVELAFVFAFSFEFAIVIVIAIAAAIAEISQTSLILLTS